MLQLYSSPINNFIHHPPIPASGIQMPNHRKEHKQKSCSKRGACALRETKIILCRSCNQTLSQLYMILTFGELLSWANKLKVRVRVWRGMFSASGSKLILPTDLIIAKFSFFLFQSFLDGNLSGKRCNDRHTTPTKTTWIFWRIRD